MTYLKGYSSPPRLKKKAVIRSVAFPAAISGLFEWRKYSGKYFSLVLCMPHAWTLPAPRGALLPHSRAHRSPWRLGSGLGFPGRDFSADWEAAGSTGWSPAGLIHCLYEKQLPFLVGHLLKPFLSFPLKSNNEPRLISWFGSKHAGGSGGPG